MGKCLKILIAFFCLLSFFEASATHNRAGEITYQQIGPLTIRLVVTTYTKASSVAADRDSLLIQWGDGTEEFVLRTNGGGEGEILGNDIKINKYIADHTYPGRSTYTVGFQDPNRIANILNVNWPNSIDVRFFLSTTFSFLDPQFQGFNNSAVLLQPPLDQACVGKVFTHNPNAFDVDGDSLSYEFAIPLMDSGEEVPAYRFPDEIGAGPDNDLKIDPITGTITWDSPKVQGEYNIAIKINEYRNGLLLNTIIRDMQISVRDCDNEPPTVDAVDEICVVAGEAVDLNIGIGDPNDGDRVTVSATGGPFEVEDSKAEMVNAGQFQPIPYSARFTWQTTCDHVSDQYYQVVISAMDDFFGDTIGLTTLHTIRIKVVAPPPENLTAITEDGDIRLFWDQPYTCEVTNNEFFQGFSVWRRIGSIDITIDECDPGLSGGPYEKIRFRTDEVLNGRYTYLDQTAEKGVTYCYRVLAEFAKKSPTGQPFNTVESIPSDEVCQQLNRDLPLITKVSIATTNETAGTVDVRYAKPLAGDLDTIMNPGPYRYEVFRSLDGGVTFTELSSFAQTATFFAEDIDTSFVDTGLNTVDLQPVYAIDFYANGDFYGRSQSVSSTFLSISPSDELNDLSWSQAVPWSIVEYNVFRENDLGVFEFLATTEETNYSDRNLVNGDEYCYYIEAIGTYSIPNIEDPLVNNSQIVCAQPLDNVAPCAPQLAVENVCNDDGTIDMSDDLVNTLIYTRPNIDCNETDDVESYVIYFSPFENQELEVIDQIFDEQTNRYFHTPEDGISGCYVVTAVDADGNESEPSERVCVDNCPAYELPNTFTPNNDGANELFVPIVNRFIANVDFNVFNEWGNKVFESSDPSLDWDGKDFSGNELPEGVYYYTCRVFENRVSGIAEGNRILKGYIQIIK